MIYENKRRIFTNCSNSGNSICRCKVCVQVAQDLHHFKLYKRLERINK